MVVYFFCCIFVNVIYSKKDAQERCIMCHLPGFVFLFPKKKITVRFSGGFLGAGSLVRFKVVCCVFPVHDKRLRLFLDALPVSDLLECKLLEAPIFLPCVRGVTCVPVFCT